jgi:hypothetical protein
MNLTGIQHLYSHDGPFVTIHMDVSRTTEDASQQLDARWRRARQCLEGEGVDEAAREGLRERIYEPTNVSGEVRRTLVWADDEILLDDVRAGHTTWPEATTVGPLPDLSAWIAQADGQLPFVLVTADREGADIDFYRAISKPYAKHDEVHGSTLHLTKVPQGDWAQKRFQQRAENVWRRNAREVADAVRSAVADHRPRVVILAGDERARSVTAESLDGLHSEVVQVESGGRAPGSSDEALWSEVGAVLSRLEADDDQRVTDRLLEKTGQGSGAARGLADVLKALVQGQVERLVLDLEAAHGLTVTPSEHPGLALPSRAANEVNLPADQVLVAAGAKTDAVLSVLPTELTKGGGVAALLRWDG